MSEDRSRVGVCESLSWDDFLAGIFGEADLNSRGSADHVFKVFCSICAEERNKGPHRTLESLSQRVSFTRRENVISSAAGSIAVRTKPEELTLTVQQTTRCGLDQSNEL